MAHTKAGGSTKLGRDSQGQRLGIKAYDGQKINAGSIIVRQRGTKYEPGANVGKGVDDTLFAKATGTVKYSKHSAISFTGRRHKKTAVSVDTQA